MDEAVKKKKFFRHCRLTICQRFWGLTWRIDTSEEGERGTTTLSPEPRAEDEEIWSPAQIDQFVNERWVADFGGRPYAADGAGVVHNIPTTDVYQAAMQFYIKSDYETHSKRFNIKVRKTSTHMVFFITNTHITQYLNILTTHTHTQVWSVFVN